MKPTTVDINDFFPNDATATREQLIAAIKQVLDGNPDLVDANVLSKAIIALAVDKDIQKGAAELLETHETSTSSAVTSII